MNSDKFDGPYCLALLLPLQSCYSEISLSLCTRSLKIYFMYSSILVRTSSSVRITGCCWKCYWAFYWSPSETYCNLRGLWGWAFVSDYTFWVPALIKGIFIIMVLLGPFEDPFRREETEAWSLRGANMEIGDGRFSIPCLLFHSAYLTRVKWVTPYG